MHADRGVGGAGTAGDEADAGLAGHLAVGLGHECRAPFLAVDHEADVRVVQRIEHVQVAFAGDAEGGVDAVDVERIDQELAAGAGRVGHGEVILEVLASSAFYVSTPVSAFEMATLNFRFLLALLVAGMRRGYAYRIAIRKFMFSD